MIAFASFLLGEHRFEGRRAGRPEVAQVASLQPNRAEPSSKKDEKSHSKKRLTNHEQPICSFNVLRRSGIDRFDNSSDDEYNSLRAAATETVGKNLILNGAYIPAKSVRAYAPPYDADFHWLGWARRLMGTLLIMAGSLARIFRAPCPGSDLSATSAAGVIANTAGN